MEGVVETSAVTEDKIHRPACINSLVVAGVKCWAIDGEVH